MKYIGLLDCNNFFVSCERLFRPDLLNKPVIVLSGNDGCVVARSNEIKKMGIKMGVPHFKIKNELKAANVAIFSSNFSLYQDVSARVMQVLQEEVSQVEQYSIDEAFFAVDGGSYEEIIQTLSNIKKVVEQKVGIPVSVGAAKTKTIAKYASAKEKQGSGVCFLADKHWQAEIAHIPIYEIWGVGAQVNKKMTSHSIFTVKDFLDADKARVDKIFGIGGLRLRDELSEVSIHKIGSMRASQQSIMSTRSFSQTTNDKNVLMDSLAYHVAHAAEELRKLNLKTKHVNVIARASRYSDWALRTGSADVVLDEPTNDTRVLLSEVRRLLDTFFDAEVPYKKAGVVFSLLTDANIEQLNLFTSTKKSDNAVMSMIDMLNKKFGKATIGIGLKSQTDMWQSSKKYLSPQYTTKWSDIAIVKG